ncbi:MAG: hypothetical protein AAGA69_04140 [Pseudomonadota bacterium]
MISTIASAAAGAEPPADTDMTALILVLVGIGALVLFVFIAGKVMGRPDPEISEEYPLPLDIDKD